MQRTVKQLEFQEEPPTNSKRQSRLPQRSVSATPGTIQKFTGRPSRLPRHRSSSNDRQSNALFPFPNSSNKKRAITPQRTTPRNLTTNRALFTVEKTRNHGLHNDKKWVDERSQEILTYLQNAQVINLNSLRQMTVKQFVDIMKFFIHIVAGNRLNIEGNYVDDIVNILQKLNYPQQVNKSWLKTPTTLNSFGNIIVMLDFLMDFAPPQTAEGEQDLKFAVDVPSDTSEETFLGKETLMASLDVEFQEELLKNTEAAFILWNKQLEDGVANLERKSSDVLIFKTCGIENSAALDSELEKLQTELNEIEKQCPPIDKNDEEKFHQMEENLKHINNENDIIYDDIEDIKQQIKKSQAKKLELTTIIEKQESEINAMQEMIDQQILSVEERDKLIAENCELKNSIQSLERTLREIEDQSLQLEVQQARQKKNITDRIETLNACVRNLMAQFYTNLNDLENPKENELLLPLNATQKDVKQFMLHLQKFRKQLVHKTVQLAKQSHQEEMKAKHIWNEIETEIEIKHKLILNTLNVTQKQLQQVKMRIKCENEALAERFQNAEKKSKELQMNLNYQMELNEQKKTEVNRLKAKNENYLKETEEKYAIFAGKREKLLNEVDKQLQANMKKCEELCKRLAENKDDQSNI